MQATRLSGPLDVLSKLLSWSPQELGPALHILVTWSRVLPWAWWYFQHDADKQAALNLVRVSTLASHPSKRSQSQTSIWLGHCISLRHPLTGTRYADLLRAYRETILQLHVHDDRNALSPPSKNFMAGPFLAVRFLSFLLPESQVSSYPDVPAVQRG